jgi:hypothetical protein
MTSHQRDYLILDIIVPAVILAAVVAIVLLLATVYPSGATD